MSNTFKDLGASPKASKDDSSGLSAISVNFR